MKNIVLIGMPGVGKSTIGNLLSQQLDMSFIDTDMMIRQKSGKSPQQIIDEHGSDKFHNVEEDVVLGLNLKNFVVSTGGSVVYSHKALNHLKNNGVVVYLKSDYKDIEKRIRNIKTRGIAFKEGQDLTDLYKERVPLYEKYADITIDCTDKNIKEVLEMVVDHTNEKRR